MSPRCSRKILSSTDELPLQIIPTIPHFYCTLNIKQCAQYTQLVAIKHTKSNHIEINTHSSTHKICQSHESKWRFSCSWKPHSRMKVHSLHPQKLKALEIELRLCGNPNKQNRGLEY